jgi:diguanylate cyclase (GGDEF)-like protein/PAS domain S-box-containing protein
MIDTTVASDGALLRVLMVEDAPADAELCERELKRAGLRIVTRCVDTRPAYEQALDDFMPDLIISDFSLPTAFDGLTALDLARMHSPDVPFVFVSGTIGEERAVEAMKRGATDYVLKDRLNRLVPVIERALHEVEERHARRVAEEELGETQRRLNSILSSLSDVVSSYAVAPPGMLYMSEAAENVYGRSTADFLASPELRVGIVHPEDRGAYEAAWQKVLEGGRFDLEYRVVRPDGTERWIHGRGTPARDAGGAVVRIDSLARDVTSRRTNEERIARLTRIQAVLSGINAAIVRLKDKQQLYEEVCRIAIEEGQFQLAWVGELDKATHEVNPVARRGVGDSHAHVGKRSASADAPRGGGALGLAVRSQQAVAVNDVRTDPRVGKPGAALAHGLLSFAVLPLITEDGVSGVVVLYAAETDFFDADELRLLSDLAGNISFALDSMNKAAKLDHLAYYDALTGLPNRSLFYDRVGQSIARASGTDQKVAVVALDLERFRTVNETLGVAAGDAFLKRTAERLLNAVGEGGTVARLSADRFTLSFSHSMGEVDLARLLQDRVLAALEAPVSIGGQELCVPAKAGIAIHPADGAAAEALVLNAEAALNSAKRSGTRFLFYARQMNARVAEKLKLENELRSALRDNQFILYYQTRVALATGKVCGLEALIRWRSPTRGMVMPGEFIPVLEETGMILDVGRWAFTQAAADAAAWRGKGLTPPPIGVNVSAIQLKQPNFVEDMIKAMQDRTGVGKIDIELTESMIMEDVQGSGSKLSAIRAAGIGIAIDDFGTGYSSLSYLARLPIDTLKIDQSFIREMNTSPEHLAIVTTVISLAHSLKMNVVAEGVETEEQAGLLRLLRCDEAQGYLYSRPQPPDVVAGTLS